MLRVFINIYLPGICNPFEFGMEIKRKFRWEEEEDYLFIRNPFAESFLWNGNRFPFAENKLNDHQRVNKRCEKWCFKEKVLKALFIWKVWEWKECELCIWITFRFTFPFRASFFESMSRAVQLVIFFFFPMTFTKSNILFKFHPFHPSIHSFLITLRIKLPGGVRMLFEKEKKNISNLISFPPFAIHFLSRSHSKNIFHSFLRLTWMSMYQNLIPLNSMVM